MKSKRVERKTEHLALRILDLIRNYFPFPIATPTSVLLDANNFHSESECGVGREWAKAACPLLVSVTLNYTPPGGFGGTSGGTEYIAPGNCTSL